MKAERGNRDSHGGLVSPRQIPPDVSGHGIEDRGREVAAEKQEDGEGRDRGRKEGAGEARAGDSLAGGVFRTTSAVEGTLCEVSEEGGTEQGDDRKAGRERGGAQRAGFQI